LWGVVVFFVEFLRRQFAKIDENRQLVGIFFVQKILRKNGEGFCQGVKKHGQLVLIKKSKIY